MVAPHSPIGSRRRLGAELRRLRTESGLTLDEVAELMTCSTSKISRLETGKGVPKVPDVSELLRIYGGTSDAERETLLKLVHGGREHGWWESYTEGVQTEKSFFASPSRYTSLENDASAVRSFDLTVLHGLLQTVGYGRAVMASVLPHHSLEEIERLLALRQRRQEAMRRTSPPLEVMAVVDESILRRQVGGPEVMAEQLNWLLAIDDIGNVDVRVLPFSAGLVRAHASHFVLLDIPRESGSDVVYVEGLAGPSFLDSAGDVRLYRDVFEEVLAHTLPAAEGRDVIGGYRAEYVHG